MRSRPIFAAERATATLSALIAAAIIAGALTASDPQPSPGDQLARQESDLRFQLGLAYKQQPRLLRSRTSELDAALNAYRRSAQTVEDASLLAEWLEQSLLASLPPRREPLPAPPPFRSPLENQVAPVAAPTNGDEAPKPAATVEPAAAEPHAANLASDLAETPAQLEPIPVPESSEPAPADSSSAPKPTPDAAAAAATVPPDGDVVLDLPAPPAADAGGPEPTLADDAEDEPLPAPAASPLADPLPSADPRPLAKQPVSVAINLAELNARVRGYHDGLAEIEAAVVAEHEPFAWERLDELVTTLERLSAQKSFIDLYCGALTAAERKAVVVPRSCQGVLEALEREVAASLAAEGDEFLAPFAADHAGSLLLERLRKLEAAEK
jgi:hypothetical protein